MLLCLRYKTYIEKINCQKTSISKGSKIYNAAHFPGTYSLKETHICLYYVNITVKTENQVYL